MNKEGPADMRGKTDMRDVFARKRNEVLKGVVAVVMSCGELQNLGLKSAQVTILDKRSHPLAPGSAYLTFKRSERCITLDDVGCGEKKICLSMSWVEWMQCVAPVCLKDFGSLGVIKKPVFGLPGRGKIQL